MAFALAVPLPRGKHTHVRDLVYAAEDDVSRAVAGNPDLQQAVEQMYVKLNFEGGVCLKRTYTVHDRVTDFSIFDASGEERPLLEQEFKEYIASLGLNIAEFCLYQDRLIAYTRQNLIETFEKLSGSLEFKSEYESLLEVKKKHEDHLRQTTEKLKEKRHEKIKMKGLSEYQEQIQNCMTEQKQVSELLAIVKILTKEKEVAKLTASQT